MAATESPSLFVISYHDVVVTEEEAIADETAVTVGMLVQHFAWLNKQGYQPIDLATWRAAKNPEELPAKPVLLTFDDGYASFYNHVLPLLQLFNYPAVLAPVTSWIDTHPNKPVNYAGTLEPRERFLTWPQLAEIATSGLVEIASHTHDLHKGVIGNALGNLQPAAMTRIFDPVSGEPETERQYEVRILDDLARSIVLIEQHTGVTPQTIVWPYGRYTASTNAAAQALGLDNVLTLNNAPNRIGSRVLGRALIGSDMTLFDFAMTVHNMYPQGPLRAAHVDLDYIYDPDPLQTELNLGALLERIKAMGLSAVFLQAFADPDGDGVADALYFRNRHLPVRADLFNRAAWQLNTRANVAVYAWMPVLAFELADTGQNERLAVRAWDGSETEQYHRLSPFDAEARQIVQELYQDLGQAAFINGVLFHDDAYLTDKEDSHPAAVEHYLTEWQMQPDDPGLAARKTEFLGEFTDVLADELRAFHPHLKTVRNLYARLVIEPESEAWFAQNFTDFTRRYDYTAIMAMPYLEQARDPEKWLENLVARVKDQGAISRTLFHLQTVDWRDNTPLSETDLARQFNLLMTAGAKHIAYYPDDFVTGHPAVQLVRSHLSVNTYPALAE